MYTLSGFIAEFDKAMVVYKDVSYFGPVREDLIALTVQYSQLNHLEILIRGYDDDVRSLYEVPEVRRWINILHTRWPDALFWLTPGSLWTSLLCLNPEMHKRLPDGRLQIALDTDHIYEQFAASVMAGDEVLREAGMAEDLVERACDQALKNLSQMFDRKQLGDYVVVHPKDGKILTYRSEN